MDRLQKKSAVVPLVPLLLSFTLALSACTSTGGNLISDAAPKSGDQQASIGPEARQGTNPNDNRRLKNTQNALTEYCPSLRIRAGTETLRLFKPGSDKSNDDNLRYQATITKVARECAYVGQNLEITMGARGRVITGPAGSAGNLQMPIRVAVQQGGCVRHFQLHRQPATIGSGQTSTQFEFVDDKVVIPAPTSTNVRMFIGFDETPNAKPSAKTCA